MIHYVYDAISEVKPEEIITVVGYKREIIEKILNKRLSLRFKKNNWVLLMLS